MAAAENSAGIVTTIEYSPERSPSAALVSSLTGAILPNEALKALREKGATFYDWHPGPDLKATMRDDETLIRLVASFATTPADVDGFLSAL